MNCGIYTITNKVDNKIYVGYCSDFIKRGRIHTTYLKRGKGLIYKDKYKVKFNN